mgnify:FL=1
MIYLTALKIIGTVLGFLAALIFIVLILPVSASITSSDTKKTEFKIKILFFTVFSSLKSEKKKKSDSSEKEQKSSEKEQNSDKYKRIKHVLGIDRFDSFEKLYNNVKKGGIDGTFSKTLGIIKFVLKRLKEVLNHIKLKKLNITYISGGDSASSAAFGYGIACSAVFPVSGYIQAVTNGKDNVLLDVKCDFDADKPRFNIEAKASIKAYFLLKTAINLIKRYLEESK